MNNADDKSDLDLPSFPPDSAHEAWFLSEGNLPFMGNVTRRQSRFVWQAARCDADKVIERLSQALKEVDRHACKMRIRGDTDWSWNPLHAKKIHDVCRRALDNLAAVRTGTK